MEFNIPLFCLHRVSIASFASLLVTVLPHSFLLNLITLQVKIGQCYSITSIRPKSVEFNITQKPPDSHRQTTPPNNLTEAIKSKF